MRAGTRLHAELEAQTSKLVEVHVDTWEDFWAVSGAWLTCWICT